MIVELVNGSPHRSGSTSAALAEVERVLPDWREARRWLREQGDTLMARLPRD